MAHTEKSNRFEIVSTDGKLWSLDTMSIAHISTYLLKDKTSGELYWQASDIVKVFGNKPIKLFFTFGANCCLIDLSEYEAWGENDIHICPLQETEYTQNDLKTITEVI